MMRLLLREAAEAFFPQRCVACGRFGAALHPECFPTLTHAEAPRCLRCWQPGVIGTCAACIAAPPAFQALRTPFRFDGVARRALLEAKFAGITALLEPLAEAAAAVVPPNWAIDVVASVPLHPRRERQRGYNQAALLAAVVAKHLGVLCEARLLRRVRATPPQAGLDAARRAQNLTHAFDVSSPTAVPKRVLLVDDVTTTGATFEACAGALLDAGVAAVFALAIARED